MVTRVVRKVLFSLGIWLPGRCRRSTWRTPPAGPTASRSLPDDLTSGIPTNNNKNNGRLGRSISAACLNVRSIKNKTALISDIINEYQLQLIGLTETWHECHDDVALRKITFPGYRCIEAARKPNREGKCYGGIAVVHKDTMSAKPFPFQSAPTTFEVIATRFSSAGAEFIFVVIYRPGSSTATELFFTELEQIFESLATYNDQVIITGDFNIKVNINGDPHATRLIDLIQSFGFIQSVTGPTHTHGNTLDLVITRSDLPHPSVTVDLPQVSDHSLVRFQIPIHRPPPQILNINTRAWKSFDTERFREDLLKSELCSPGIYEGMSVDQAQELYDSTLSSLLDKHSPRRTAKRRYQPLTPVVRLGVCGVQKEIQSV